MAERMRSEQQKEIEELQGKLADRASPPGASASRRGRPPLGVWRSYLGYSPVRRRSWALMATMTVLADISTAPMAGFSTTPQGCSTPAASGIATML